MMNECRHISVGYCVVVSHLLCRLPRSLRIRVNAITHVDAFPYVFSQGRHLHPYAYADAMFICMPLIVISAFI